MLLLKLTIFFSMGMICSISTLAAKNYNSSNPAIKTYLENCYRINNQFVMFQKVIRPRWYPKKCQSLVPPFGNGEILTIKGFIAKWVKAGGAAIVISPRMQKLKFRPGYTEFPYSLSQRSVDETVTKLQKTIEQKKTWPSSVALALGLIKKCDKKYALSLKELLSKISFADYSDPAFPHKVRETVRFGARIAQSRPDVEARACGKYLPLIKEKASRQWETVKGKIKNKDRVAHQCGSVRDYHYSLSNYPNAHPSLYQGHKMFNFSARAKPSVWTSENIECQKFFNNWRDELNAQITKKKREYEKQKRADEKMIEENQSFR